MDPYSLLTTILDPDLFFINGKQTIKKTNFREREKNISSKFDNITLDPDPDLDPNWAKLQDPYLNSMLLDQCIPTPTICEKLNGQSIF